MAMNRLSQHDTDSNRYMGFFQVAERMQEGTRWSYIPNREGHGLKSS